MKIRLILKLLGGVNLFLCAFMIPPFLLAVVERDGWHAFAWSLVIGMLFSGLLLWRFRDVQGEIRVREGFLLVTLVWCLSALFGALPFYFSGYFGSFTNAVFESVSGYTTTGATVLARVSTVPRGYLLWRSMIQWLGGMGIVLLSLAVMPLLGFGGVQLFKAEVPGPSVERIRPRIRVTATLLWWVYALLTVAAALSLMVAGMPVFDAVCHAFTVMATGGFSTHDQGIMGYQNPAIEIVLIVFMLMAGINFVLHYQALTGRWKAYANNENFRWYIGLLLALSVAVTALLIGHVLEDTFLAAIRHAVFQVVSLMTTTGDHSADFEAWRLIAPAVFMLLITAMFFGGMAGSTGGGMKTVRVVTLLKLMRNALVSLIHPRAVLRLQSNGITLTERRINMMIAFMGLHLMVFLVASIIMAGMGLDIVSALSATAASLNNIGPGFGIVGPLDNYAAIPTAGKWVLAIVMIIGRLELFTVLVLLIPDFWRR